jgi:hypothetical protein
MSPQSFWVASFETRHFTFTTYAETQVDAFEQLENAWHEHQQRTGAWHDFSVYRDDVYARKITIPDTEIN